jgi:flagellar basal body P-ring formation protein FlgA
MKLGRFLRISIGAALVAAWQGVSAVPAAAQDTVVVPKEVIYPGEMVTAALISEVRFNRDPAILASVAVLPEDVDGKVAKRTLLPGRMIPLNSLRDAYAVEAGSPVEVVFVAGALIISVAGVPLQSGAVGDVIRVRNVDSGAVLTGTVLADGTIRVGAI